MYPEYNKKISVKDYLKVGDLVAGQHVDRERATVTIVAGSISEIRYTNCVTYYVIGNAFKRPFGDTARLSGILEENEVEVIDSDTCTTIIELFALANQQLIAGASYQRTIQKIRELRQKSRQELEEKYPDEAQWGK